MPAGSDYQGPTDALAKYIAAVEGAGEPVKGAKNPYTSRNGHMFSFLDADGSMALRLSDDLTEEFESSYETGPVIQYGSVMRDYRSVPADLFDDADTLRDWFKRSYDWIGTLEPKPTKK